MNKAIAFLQTMTPSLKALARAARPDLSATEAYATFEESLLTREKPRKRHLNPSGSEPPWPRDRSGLRAVRCEAFLALCGVITEAERRRIMRRIAKWDQREQG